MDITVRRLGAEDLVAARELVALFREIFADEAVDRLALPQDRYLGTLLTQDAFYAIAAFDGGRVVGGATAYGMPMFLTETWEAYLYDLAVHEDWRRQGVASAILERLVTEAREAGVATIFVEAEAEDGDAVSFYRSTAAEELDVRHFVLDLADPAL